MTPSSAPLSASVHVPVSVDNLLACPDCDLLHQRLIQPSGKKALCIRCGGLLYRRRDRGIDTGLALILSGLILFAVINLAPLLTLEMSGLKQEITLWSGVMAFVERDEWLLALLVFFTLIAFPLFRFGGLLYVLYPLHQGRVPAHAARIYRLCHSSTPWSMLEIFLLGGLVAAVKLGETGNILPGVAAYAFVALILVSAWADYIVEPADVWERIGITYGKSNRDERLQ